jgi:pimeloyl-ACP methyl ester carboxylesterase
MLGVPKAYCNGININYTVEGLGEPLIMISGFSSEKNVWRFQTGSFKKDFRTITFDNRGVGKSDKPTGPYTMKMMADDTIGLMDHLGIEKAHVVGMSMGGMVAQELAINYPECVDKLVLASTFACMDEASGLTSEASKRLETYNGSLPNEEVIRKGVETMINLSLNNGFYRILALQLMKIMIRSFDKLALNGLVRQFEAILAHDTIDRLRLIKAPTLVITGDNDRLIKPISSDMIANLVPKAKLVKVEGGSHAINIEMKSEFNKKVLEFLKK